MASSVQWTSSFQALNSRSSTPVDLRSARGDINEIRSLLKGDINMCHELFRKAKENNDWKEQETLAKVLCEMEWKKDSEKDFSSLKSWDLEPPFLYYPDIDLLMEVASDQAKPRDLNGTEKFDYRIAFLRCIHRRWLPVDNKYGMAVQLRPFFDMGEAELDRYFLDILKAVFPNQNLDTIGSVESYRLEGYDVCRIRSLLDQYKIEAVSTKMFQSDRGGSWRDVGNIDGVDGDYGFFLLTLNLYSGPGKYMDRISIRDDNFNIYETFDHPQLQPVIEFVKKVMIRTGSSSAAESWLNQIKRNDSLTDSLIDSLTDSSRTWI